MDEAITNGGDQMEPVYRADKKGQYYSVAELMSMSVDELQHLWDEVPAERQAFYEGAYGAALESIGTGDVTDDAAMGIIEQILSHYDSGQVPILSEGRWVQVPGWVRAKVEAGEDLSQEIEAVAEPKGGVKPKTSAKAGAKPRAARSGPTLPMIAAGVGAALVFICVAIMLIQRLVGGDQLSEEEATGTAVAELTAAPTITITPLSLSDADQIIRDGEDFKGYYPVILDVKPNNGGVRIFVVQQRPVEIAEWQFDPNNPDVASWVSGLIVRPVLGIPYTEENATLMNNLKPDDAILLHMSTGTTLEFRVSNVARVSVQDTNIFRQVTPGIALVLIGDINSPDRLTVFGEYLPNQEVVGQDQTLNIGNSSSSALAVGQGVPVDGSGGAITAVEAYPSLGGNELPPDLAYLFVDVLVSAGEAPVDTNNLSYGLIDAGGARYSPATYNTAFAKNPPFLGAVVARKTELAGTVGFLVPRAISQAARLVVTINPGAQQLSYNLRYTAPTSLAELAAQVSFTSVSVKKSAGKPDRVLVKATISNPNAQPMTIKPTDFYVVYVASDPGSAFPTGAHILPVTVNGFAQLESVIQPNQALLVEAEFDWDKSPYAAFFLLGFQFVVQLV